MTDQGIYLFCFARDLSCAPEGTGLDRTSPLEIQRCGEIAAVVSATPLDELGDEAKMKDVEWLAPRALWHERVIEQVAASSPVLPARMGTVFSTREKLTQLMAHNHDRILHFLEHVAGHDEWAVKIFLDRPKALEARIHEEMAKSPLSASPGTRYLQEQRIRSQAERGVQDWWSTTREQIRDQLTAIAAELVERKPLPLESAPGQMVANWAFLVDRESLPEFHARVHDLDEKYQRSGLRLEDAGAWPPYSFTPSLSP
jgi:hypothetical protein